MLRRVCQVADPPVLTSTACFLRLARPHGWLDLEPSSAVAGHGAVHRVGACHLSTPLVMCRIDSHAPCGPQVRSAGVLASLCVSSLLMRENVLALILAQVQPPCVHTHKLPANAGAGFLRWRVVTRARIDARVAGPGRCCSRSCSHARLPVGVCTDFGAGCCELAVLRDAAARAVRTIVGAHGGSSPTFRGSASGTRACAIARRASVRLSVCVRGVPRVRAFTRTADKAVPPGHVMRLLLRRRPRPAQLPRLAAPPLARGRGLPTSGTPPPALATAPRCSPRPQPPPACRPLASP